MSDASIHVDRAPRVGERFYYGWVVLGVSTLAMIGTLPGRTQGLGLVTEQLLKDLSISRVNFAQINLVATLIGSLFCIGIGKVVDRVGSRIVLTVTALALGLTVLGMSQLSGAAAMLVAVTLTPPPDLAVTDIVAPPTAVEGAIVDVTWTVTNRGAGIAAGSWRDRVLLQKAGDPASTVELGTLEYVGPLQAGTSYTRSEAIRLPSQVNGLYKIAVIANFEDAVSSS